MPSRIYVPFNGKIGNVVIHVVIVIEDTLVFGVFGRGASMGVEGLGCHVPNQGWVLSGHPALAIWCCGAVSRRR